MKDKTLAASAYIFAIPSLYIVLTEKRRDEFIGYHGAQALRLWTFFCIIFFVLRFLVNLLWSFIYIPYLDLLEIFAALAFWIYALYCGLRSYRGEKFDLFF